MIMLPYEVLAKLDDLQNRYILALDSADMEAWLATFASTGSYVCLTAEADDAGLPIALVLDDCYARLQDRVKFVDRVWAGTVHRYRTRHIVQRVMCEQAAAHQYIVHSNFICAYSRSDTRTTEVYAAGKYVDEVQVEDGKFAFRAKRAIMDGDYLKHYMVYPM